MALSPQWLDELRARITLSSVIGRTTKLQKAGHEWKACCPFHDEKSPSFTVSDQKGFYHCFGCGAHGDAIRWMTDQRGLSFIDAVKELASEAGLEVPAADPRAARAAEERAGLHDVMVAAQDWFRQCLAGDSGAKARAYLATRGFDAHSVERFGFGFAPDDRGALTQALGRFDQALLIEAGLLIQVDDRAPYARFRGRLMLPIHDARGRIVAFGGRILDADNKDAPKYLNSPDTPLFDKGRTLYNLHRAGPLSRQSDRMVVVEGYMDVIALAAAGIGDAVAPMGTALTERQIELLWRMVPTPVLCFDGDAAGRRAAMRAIARALPMLRPSHSLGIVRLPAGLDPDDLVRRDGPQAMERLLANPASLLDVVWDHERDAAPLDTPEAKAGLRARLIGHVETITDRNIASLYRRDLLKRYSEFAFPARDWSNYGNVTDISSAKKWPRGARSAFRKPSDGLLRNYEKPNERQRHLHRRLGAAITAGLMNFPDLVIPWAETLIKAPEIDARLDTFINMAFDCDSLTTTDLEEALRIAKLKPPLPVEWDNLRFPFAWPPKDLDNAIIGLENAMRLYVGLPQVRIALREATAVLERTFSEAAFLEQQRLRRLLSELQVDSHRIDKAA